jgi:hypothetical protein
MPFNTDRFSGAEFSRREGVVKVPALAEWFDEGESPEFSVRGLTFAELCQADSAADKSKSARRLIEALSGGTSNEQTGAIKEALGFSDDTPPQMAKRVEMLILGAVEPVFDRQTAVKLSEAFPVEFRIITDEIVKLTGQGQEPGKHNGSGASQTPEQ